MSTLSEFDVISRYMVPLTAGEPGALRLQDDAGVIEPPQGLETVVTTDCLVAGVHFLDNDPPEVFAARALRTNLSDLAAMGAKPGHYTLALCLSDAVDEAWISGFVEQLAADQKAFGISLLGGDTIRTPGPLTITITAMGQVPTGETLKRSTAQNGDHVYVSGTIGDGALGLKVRKSQIELGEESLAKYAVSRFHFPTPRLELGQTLRHHATACTDISDGLARDLTNICRASGCCARIEFESIPLSDACRYALDNHLIDPHTILSGGDDYELVFTGPPDLGSKLSSEITRIGIIESQDPGGDPLQIHKDGRLFSLNSADGYEHKW